MTARGPQRERQVTGYSVNWGEEFYRPCAPRTGSGESYNPDVQWERYWDGKAPEYWVTETEDRYWSEYVGWETWHWTDGEHDIKDGELHLYARP